MSKRYPDAAQIALAVWARPLDTTAMNFAAPLPIDAVLGELRGALATRASAVLVAPPGAGKTTRVPPALAEARPGRVVMLEPRRVAARAATRRMASEHGWTVGREVGYQIRFERRFDERTHLP